MKIPKIFTIATAFLPFCLFSVLLLSGCSSDDDLTPSNADINGFAPADDDNSATAQIRRNFYNSTGAYLLFTDTLVSYSTNGQPELFDATYSITGSSVVSNDIYDYDYHYVYITDPEMQRKAADTVRQYLVAKLGKQTPFSFFLVDDIYYNYTTWSGRVRQTHLPMLIASRGYIVSTQSGDLYDDPESMVNSLLSDILIDRIKKTEETYSASFFAFSSQYYGEDFDDLGLSLDDFENDPTLIWNYGMFGYGTWGGYFYYQSRDTSDWVDVILTQDRDTFAETYGSSSVMMAKYDALKKAISDMGFNI